MICERFDDVVVPFNRANGHTVLAMITRATHTQWPGDQAIEDLRPTGLRDPSVVRFKVFTLDNRVLQRRIGRLGDDDAGGCAAALDTILRA
jgi:mRNA interferase MazF